MSIGHAPIDTPIGTLTAGVDADGRLAYLSFPGRCQAAAASSLTAAMAHRIACVRDELAAYFAGGLRNFALPLAPEGTAFQHRVWEQLQRIPYGTTISYLELATRLGNPAATRAVARANATNPIPVVIPCHRVIGADGTLTGYGGGLDRKRFLLALEGAPAGGARQLPLGVF